MRLTWILLTALALVACAKTPKAAPSANPAQAAPGSGPLALSAPAAPPFMWGDNDLREAPANDLYYTARELQEKGELGEALQLMYYAELAGHEDALFALAELSAQAKRTDDALYWLQRAAVDEGLTSEDLTDHEAFSEVSRDPRWPEVLAFVEATHTKFATSGLRKVELVVPAGYEASRTIPVVIGLHGYRSNPTHFVSELQPLADALDVAFVGVSATIPYGPSSFVWSGDPARDAAHVRAAIDSIKDKVKAAPGPVTFGFSQGGLLAAELLALEPEVYSGALVLSPGGDSTPFRTLRPSATLLDRRMLVVVGDGEHVGNLSQADALASWFRAAGADAYLRETSEQEDHTFPADFSDAMPRWLSFLWGEELPPSDVGYPSRVQVFGPWVDDDDEGDHEAALGTLRVLALPATSKIEDCLRSKLGQVSFAEGFVVTQLDLDGGAGLRAQTTQDTTENASIAGCVRDGLASIKESQGITGRYYIGVRVAWADPAALDSGAPWAGLQLSATRTESGPSQADLDAFLRARRPRIDSCLQRALASHPLLSLDTAFELERSLLAEVRIRFEKLGAGSLERCLQRVFGAPDARSADWKFSEVLARGSMRLVASPSERQAFVAGLTMPSIPDRLALEPDASRLTMSPEWLAENTDDAGLEVTDMAQLRPYTSVWPVVETGLPKLQKCVDRLSSAERAEMSAFALELKVDPKGKVSLPSPLSGQPPSLSSCVLAEVRKWKLPAIKSTRTISIRIPMALRGSTASVGRREHRTRLPAEPEAAKPKAAGDAEASAGAAHLAIMSGAASPAERAAAFKKLGASTLELLPQAKAAQSKHIQRLAQACGKATAPEVIKACGVAFMAPGLVLGTGDPSELFAAAKQACASGSCDDLILFELFGLPPLTDVDVESAVEHLGQACQNKTDGMDDVACPLHKLVQGLR